MKKTILGFFLLFAASATASVKVEDRIGKIFPYGHAGAEPAFIQKIHVEIENDMDRIATSTIEDASGTTVMRERALIKGGVIVEQDWDQLQEGLRYRLRIKDGEIKYQTYKIQPGEPDLLEQEKSEKQMADFVTGPSLEVVLGSKAAAFEKGESVLLNFGVFEAGRSVQFEFKPLNKAPFTDGVKLVMEPASFWLSLMVSDMHLDFDPEGHRLLRFKGRTPLRQKIKDKWKPIEAEIFFSVIDSRK
jgi:hypothetical protein